MFPPPPPPAIVRSCAPADTRATCVAIAHPLVQLVFLSLVGQPRASESLTEDIRRIVENGYFRFLPESGPGTMLPPLDVVVYDPILLNLAAQALITGVRLPDTVWVFMVPFDVQGTELPDPYRPGSYLSYHSRLGDVPYAVINFNTDRNAVLSAVAHEIAEMAAPGELADYCETVSAPYDTEEKIWLPGYWVEGTCRFGLEGRS